MNFFKCVILSILTISCAGPMTPFGAMNQVTKFEQRNPYSMAQKAPKKDHLPINISFLPKRQNLHKTSKFLIKVKDINGFREDGKVSVYYNGVNVSNKLTELSNPLLEGKKITEKQFHLPRLKLLADRSNEILITYKRHPQAAELRSHFLPPQCQMFAKNRLIATVKGFEVDQQLIDKINFIAYENDLNPHFIAGIVAQESGFDPTAVSWAKALGLMQITNLAEKEIVDKYGIDHWPRFPELDYLHVTQIKTLIHMGELNSKNEWRLDETKSITGGVHYLKFLKNYWNVDMATRKETLNFEDQEITLGDIILASYNSGASRVKKSILENGSEWLKASNLQEARKYVNKVKSYCYHLDDRKEHEIKTVGI